MSYSLRRLVAPSVPVVTVEEARAQLRIDAYGSPPSHPEDELVMSYVEAITQDLDAGTGWLGRALAPQTWQLTLTGLSGSCRIRLPYPPFIELLSFSYTNTDGSVINMTEGTNYRAIDGGDHMILAPPFNANWPTNVRDDYDSVVITYRCGYAEGSPEAVAVPELIKRYIKAALGEAYDNRDTYDNVVTKRGELTDRIPNTLNTIRVLDNRP